MRKYREYKDSGISWVGDIPKHWEIKQLRNYLTFTSKKGYPDETLLSVVREQGVIVRNIESQEENHNFIPDDLSGYKLVTEGQFVINKMKSWQGSYGVSSIRGIVSPAYYVCDLQFQEKQFFNVAIRSKMYVPFFTQYSKGIRVGQWDLSPIGLKSIPFIEPPVSEQRNIVAFLSNKSSEIENLISKTEREIELLKELKQSVVAHAVTKGLNPNAKMKDSGIGWIGEIPEHWEVKRLASAFVENREQNTVLSYTNAYKFNYGSIVPKENEGKIEELSDIYKKYTVIHPGDIVLNGLNLNYDFVSQRVAMSYDTGIITSAYLSITPRGGKMPSYHLHLLKTMDAKKLFHGIGTGIRLTMGYDELKKQMLLFPPIDEQQEIVEYIDYKTTQIDKMIVELTYKVEYLKQYKQRLIADVVTGKINVQPE